MIFLNNFQNFKHNQRYNCKKGRWKNDGSRSLFESTIHEYIYLALYDWREQVSNEKYCLIGGLAYSYYLKPRTTYDIDLIFLSYTDIPANVHKFRKHRKHAFEHIKTNVEIEVLTPEHINEDKYLFEKVFETSIISDGIRVASPIGLIAMKLGRFNNTDQSDIKNLYMYAIENNMDIDISIFNLSIEKVELFNNLISTINESSNMYTMDIQYMIKNDTYTKIETNEIFDIYIFKEEYIEPRFHVIEKSVKKFLFSISLTDIDSLKLKILESSTDYPSFNMFSDVEVKLKKWLSINNNLDNLRSTWEKINNKFISFKKALF